MCGNRTADQRRCFRYTNSAIPLLAKSEISSLWLSSVVVQPGLCLTLSETPKTGFLTTRLKKYEPCREKTSIILSRQQPTNALPLQL